MTPQECEAEWLSKYNMETGRLKESLSVQCGNWVLRNKERTDLLIKKWGSKNNNFYKPELLNLILGELSKKHIGDDKLKMTLFLTAVSGLLGNPKLRMSMAIKANSAEGKDNLSKTVLSHMPLGTAIFLTSATQATIEDDIKFKRIIAFSEVNANREAGANKYLVEVIKQKAEGGTSSLKKDIRKGMKEARHDIGEQASVLYGTTETEKDEELGTRFIEANILTDEKRIHAVNDNTCDIFSDMESIIDFSKEEDSWIRKELDHFFKGEKYEIVLPFARWLKEKINGDYIFDHASPRSQRDIKRLFALTCANVYLHQLQREKKDYKGHKFIIGIPDDLITTLEYSAKFFNQSYEGLDARLKAVLELISREAYTARDDIQDKLNITRNTVKSYCNTLAEEGLIKGVKGSDLNIEYGANFYDKNKIYYKRYQRGIKKPLIRCQINILKEFLEQKTKETLTPFLIDDNINIIDDKKVSEKKVSNNKETHNNLENGIKNPQIDTFSLTPFKDDFEELGGQK